MNTRLVRRGIVGLLCVGVLAGVGLQFTSSSSGAQLGRRALQLSDSSAGVATRYRLAFAYTSPGTVGSVAIQFCSNDPLPENSCTAPLGFDASQASIASQTGPASFTVASQTTANRIVLKRPPSNLVPSNGTYELAGITNPESPGTYYARIYTYASDDATGSATDFGGVAFSISNNVSITATVPPYLIFCTGTSIPGLNCANATGDFVNLGELSTNRVASGTSKMVVATNAANGYNITYQGGTLTSGNNELTGLTNGDVSKPGRSQFGFNLRANNTPNVGDNVVGPGVNQPLPDYNQPNMYRFVSGDSLVSYPKPDDIRQYTSTYIANIPPNQPAGIYVSTITYICLASF